MSAPVVTAAHFTDPGCPWAYSARPFHARLSWRFGAQIDWQIVLIGLREQPRPDSPYTPARQAAGWLTFRDRFGMPFGRAVKARPSATSPGCRAVVAAKLDLPHRADDVLRALQLMQFTTSGLLDEADALREALARVPGIDGDALVARIEDADVLAAYEADRAHARSAAGRPIEAQNRHASSDGPVRYTAPSVVFTHHDGPGIEVGGFQPFEAYDTALANLDVTLQRRPAPESALEVLGAFPGGLTTAEVAEVLRPSDLDAPDRGAAARELIALAGEGRIACEPIGDDALWSLSGAAT